MQISATKEPGFDIATLGATIDQPSRFQIIQAAIEGAHGLHCAAGEELSTGEDGSKGFGLINGTGEGSEHRASALRQGVNVVRAEGGAEDLPRQIHSVSIEGHDGF